MVKMGKQSRLNSWLGLSLFSMVILSNSVNSRSMLIKIDDDNNTAPIIPTTSTQATKQKPKGSIDSLATNWSGSPIG